MEAGSKLATEVMEGLLHGNKRKCPLRSSTLAWNQLVLNNMTTFMETVDVSRDSEYGTLELEFLEYCNSCPRIQKDRPVS